MIGKDRKREGSSEVVVFMNGPARNLGHEGMPESYTCGWLSTYLYSVQYYFLDDDTVSWHLPSQAGLSFYLSRPHECLI